MYYGEHGVERRYIDESERERERKDSTRPSRYSPQTVSYVLFDLGRYRIGDRPLRARLLRFWHQDWLAHWHLFQTVRSITL